MKTEKELSLYLHIPFCKTLCLYCGFVKFADKMKQIPAYTQTLMDEVKKHGQAYHNEPKRVVTIYFGGGTPGLIDPRLMEKILTSIRKYWNVSPDAEITIECNPENITLERLEQYRDMGINRLSLGIQSFNKKTLARIARPHDDTTIHAALKTIRASGWKNFGADFILGLPYQTVEMFQAEIETILSYQPQHLSAYFLSPDTQHISSFLPDCPNEDQQIAMYEFLTKRLKKAGFLHYEVSNYAQPGWQCQHNLRYWTQQEYAGLGVGAHSYLDGKVWENTSDFDAYQNGTAAKPQKLAIAGDLKQMDFLLLGLRTLQGIDEKKFAAIFGKTQLKNLLTKAAPYLQSKHMKKAHGKLGATEKGFLILDRITRDLTT